jgi:protein-tyrosine-phosphatase/DNA-binding transcriptional ArsR family regulator
VAAKPAAPPPFLQLAGHPIRWRLLRELAGSDLRVGELCTRTGKQQSLVSYHLRRLRDAGLVSTRQSLADGRDTYYVLDVAGCGDRLRRAAAALHPGLAAAPATAVVRPARVLFLCTGNSARSQMAEALIERLSSGRVSAASAGSRPKPLRDEAVQAMRARGIDIAGRRSKHLDEFTDQRFDRVITLCDRVREVCPEFPFGAETTHWSIPDPARGRASAFDQVAEELTVRIRFLLATMNPEVVAHA